jgi:hypothetical protein
VEHSTQSETNSTYPSVRDLAEMAPRAITENDTGLKILVDGNGSEPLVECASLRSLTVNKILTAQVSLRYMGGVHIQMIPGVSFAKMAWT